MTEKKKYKYRLNTIPAVRRYIAALINNIDSGLITPLNGTKIAYCCNVLIGCLKAEELSSIEQRLADLELKFNSNDQWE